LKGWGQPSVRGQKQRTALAQTILSDRYNFRDQAKVLRRKLKDINRALADAMASACRTREGRGATNGVGL